MNEIAYSLRMYYKSFADTMQRGDTIGTEFGAYAVSGILFSIAYLKIRPITKFGKAQDIPNHFIRDKLPQFGKVKVIEPSEVGALLRINHRPPLNLFFASNSRLPVKIFGIRINGNGYSWLQCVTVNHPVKFLPILRDGDNAVCQVLLLDPKGKKPALDLATALTSLGFAQVDEKPRECLSDASLSVYHKNLLKAQSKAKSSRSGLWSDLVLPPIWPIAEAQKLFWNALYSIFPIKRRLPELVR